jgi:hypothetical protein
VVCVKWFCKWANQDHYREETGILEADFEQTVHSSNVHVYTDVMEKADKAGMKTRQPRETGGVGLGWISCGIGLD